MPSSTSQASSDKICHGGGEGNRTHDPLRAKQMLSQLSYAPDNGGPGKT